VQLAVNRVASGLQTESLCAALRHVGQRTFGLSAFK
jgi:hypothetical protein